ncbi:hypothetical protein A3D07_02190 [Candidatus Curtissbacteria bacterium RIFCSPHIGHO2_02_FULL_42_15]|uniref:R3H domain-containing protein n=1 Tax=Candidatus Curtissbacteria bacterium RIFCSPHIGHO2_02_FULL_42_15 TaxID=1797716 RepID=A0A1F5GHQ2_9BACT|nr:MAG: hypothetical protein A3D07_02190 [Candidatus Curtissbacteria bacterium RIFCSPHIGHO2_02_FULL_42_15]
MAKAKLDENLVAESIREIIEKLQVPATIEVSRQDSIFFVDIDSEDSSLLIGKHGVNLESLQFILAVRLKTLTGDDDFEIYVDVGNWRRRKEEKLKQMALDAAQRVETDNEPQAIYNLTNSERRVVHVALAEHPAVETISEGEGENRHIIVKPRN